MINGLGLLSSFISLMPLNSSRLENMFVFFVRRSAPKSAFVRIDHEIEREREVKERERERKRKYCLLVMRVNH